MGIWYFLCLLHLLVWVVIGVGAALSKEEPDRAYMRFLAGIIVFLTSVTNIVGAIGAG